MKKIRKRVVLTLLALTFLFSSMIGGCGKSTDTSGLQKVTLNDEALFSSFLNGSKSLFTSIFFSIFVPF